MTEATLPETISPQSQPQATRERAIQAALLIAILIFAAAVRLHGLTRWSFWFDETATVEIIHTPWPRLLHHLIGTENTPPAYYFFLKAWIELFGDSDFLVRLPSALAGVASIFMLYRFAAYCVGRSEALIAAALMAASRYHIWYSQEARVYIFMLLLAIWSCDEFVHMLDEPPDWRRDLRYWIATLLLVYSHLFGALAVAAQLVQFAWRKISRRQTNLALGRFSQLQLAVWIPFAMWGPVLNFWFQNHAGGFWIGTVTWDDVGEAYWQYVGKAGVAGVLVFASLVVIGATRRDVRRMLPLLLSLLLLPVVLPVVVALLVSPIFITRYGMIALAGVFILAACGIARFPMLARPFAAVALGALIFFSPDPATKGPFKEISAYLNQWMQPGDYVEVNTRADLGPINHYLERTDVKHRSFFGGSIPLGVPLPDPHTHIWLMIVEAQPPQNGIATIQRGHWRVVSQKQFGDIMLFELADGATEAKDAYPDEVRFDAKPPTTDRTPPARE